MSKLIIYKINIDISDISKLKNINNVPSATRDVKFHLSFVFIVAILFEGIKMSIK